MWRASLAEEIGLLRATNWEVYQIVSLPGLSRARCSIKHPQQLLYCRVMFGGVIVCIESLDWKLLHLLFLYIAGFSIV